MIKIINLIQIILFMLFFLARDIYAQSKVDSIVSEVEKLNRNYQERITELYHQMVVLEYNKNLPAGERVKAEGTLYFFPIQQNIQNLLDSIAIERVSPNDNIKEMYPYWWNFAMIFEQNQARDPAILRKIMESLEQPKSNEELQIFSRLLDSSFRYITINSMSNSEKAACLRIMANSIIGVFQRKENLLKIADMLEQR